jgi:alpha-ribazole phosphatase
MTRIIFVRHGETEYNCQSRYQGHTDSRLSELGRCQSARVAERLGAETIAAVYSSDLVRASETAQAVAALHRLSVSTDADLRECAFGDWEGLTVKQISERFPALYRSYLRDSVTHRAPNGERLEDLLARVVRAVDSIVAAHPGGTSVIVTHGGPIRAFFCHAFDAKLDTFRKIRLDNCGITILSLGADGRWFLQSLNEAHHLEGLEMPEQPRLMAADA